MDKRKHWILRFFIVLFTMSVSVALLPCGIINAHGLFGEVTTSVVVEDKDQEIVSIKSIQHEKVKGINIFNLWFEILQVVVCISFYSNLIKLPRENTIVTLKVRMDH